MSTTSKMNSKKRSGVVHSAHGGGISHASSLSKRQKVTKDSLLKGSVVEEEVDALSSILPLRLAALGGYLPLKDAGRFLLRVSKDMTASIFEERISSDDTVAAAAADDGGPGHANDATAGGKGVTNDDSQAPDAEKDTVSLRRAVARNEAWKYLCEQKWRNPSTLDHLVSVLGGAHNPIAIEMATDWERLFRKFLRTPRKPAVKASVDDYSFVFSLMKKSQETIVILPSDTSTAIPLSTLVLKGDDAAKFLQTGETDFLALDSPVTLGNYATRSSFLSDKWGGWRHGFMSTMHVFRKSDGKSCEINWGDDLEVCDVDTEGIELQFATGGLQSVGNLEEIIDTERINCNLGFSVGQNFRITWLERDDGSLDCQISHVSFSVSLFTKGEGESYSEYYQDIQNGVTIADFLDRLDVEWK